MEHSSLEIKETASGEIMGGVDNKAACVVRPSVL